MTLRCRRGTCWCHRSVEPPPNEYQLGIAIVSALAKAETEAAPIPNPQVAADVGEAPLPGSGQPPE